MDITSLAADGLCLRLVNEAREPLLSSPFSSSLGYTVQPSPNRALNTGIKPLPSRNLLIQHHLSGTVHFIKHFSTQKSYEKGRGGERDLKISTSEVKKLRFRKNK